MDLKCSDAVIAFAGDTAWTYPLIAQISSYVESFINLRDRVMDLTDTYDLIIRMLNEAITFVSNPADPSLRIPDCSFIFAGYSARRKCFFIRRIVFHPKRLRFEGRPSRKFAGEQIVFIGDTEPKKATVRYISEQQKKDKKYNKKLGMLPAEAFLETLLSKKYPEIGGAPQVAKIYQNMTQRHFGVYWPPHLPNDEQYIYLRGRRLSRFDVLDHQWLFDPSTARLFWHDFSPGKKTQDTSSSTGYMSIQSFI